jgi:hypothetical protein
VYGGLLLLIFEELLYNIYNINLIPILVISLAILFIFIGAEFPVSWDVKSATPIRIYQDCIEAHRTSIDAIRGINSKIFKGEIVKIEVVRGSVKQNKRAFRGYVTWRNAPYELVFVLKNNKRYKTGYKYPPQVDMMIRFFREQWGINVIDKGNGIGEVFERDTDIRVNVQELIDNAYK